nr:MAG: hypothetical protein [Picornaviridae sp.]
MEKGDIYRTKTVVDATLLDKQTLERSLVTFGQPLPYTGSSLDPLTSLTKGLDISRTRYTGEQLYTSWNTQSHSWIWSVGNQIAAGVQGDPPPEVPEIKTVCLGGALRHRIQESDILLTNVAKRNLRQSKWFLTVSGELLFSLPPTVKTIHTKAELKAAKAKIGPQRVSRTEKKDEKTDDKQTSTSQESSDSEFEVLSLPLLRAADGSIVGPSAPPENLQVAVPPPMSTCKIVPVRSVDTSLVNFQSPGVQSVPKSPEYAALEQANIGSTERPQQLVPGVRSTIARDTPSIQMLVSYMESSNSSHMDTAAALRLICFIYPSHEDYWFVDKLDAHFIRRQVEYSRRANFFHMRPRPANWDALAVPLLAVTLPAFAAHLKGLDTILGNQNQAISRGYTLDNMDTAWACVPVDSEMLNSPHLMEYIMAFLSSEVWAGRSNMVWRSQHSGPAVRNTYFTSSPCAHNVFIPGPKQVMLVLVEDNAYSHSDGLLLPGVAANVQVYSGSRSIQGNIHINDYVVDIGPILNANTQTNTYKQTAARAVHALEYIQRNICTDMSMPLAMSLASELCSQMQQPLTLAPNNEATGYQNELQGAWTFGPHNFSTTPPLLSTENLSQGTVEQQSALMWHNMTAYSFASVSPLHQFPDSHSKIGHLRHEVNGDVYLGTTFCWNSSRPSRVRPGYQCHTAHGVYRVLSCLGYILKTDYKFALLSASGLQNTVTLLGVTLSLSTADLLTTNGIPLRMWNSSEVTNTPGANRSIRELTSSATYNHLKPRDVVHNVFNQLSDPDDVVSPQISACISQYYGLETTNASFSAGSPVPSFLWAQWRNLVKPEGTVFSMTNDYGVVFYGIVDRHFVFNKQDTHYVAYAATTMDCRKLAPNVYATFGRAGSHAYALPVDSWQYNTNLHLSYEHDPALFSTSVLCISSHLTYMNTSAVGEISIVNDMLHVSKDSHDIVEMTQLYYPDPPRKAFLALTQEITPDGGIRLPTSEETVRAGPAVVEPTRPPPTTTPTPPTQVVGLEALQAQPGLGGPAQ